MFKLLPILALLVSCTPDPEDTGSTPPPDSDTPTDTSDTGSTADTADTADSASDTADTAAPEPPPRTLSSGEHTFQHKGKARSYRLYLPDNLEVGAPLIVAFHGYGGSAMGIQGYAGLDALADTEGFAVVYPQSTKDNWGWNCWDIGYCSYTHEVDDVDFSRTVIDAVVADQGLEDVFVTGMSNGGDMTYRMACEASDLVKGTAPITGCLMNWLADSCSPPTPPPMLHVHGNGDFVTAWDGDENYHGGGYMGTLDSVGFIAGLHGTTAYSTETFTDKSDESAYTVHSWATADGDVPVQLYEIDGGGHNWPTGAPNYDFDAAELMWAFFQQIDG